MAEGKREKSKKYPGVYWRVNSETGEKVYYVRYRLGGRGSKEVEEPVGKSSAGMTEARAAQARALKVAGKVEPNTVKRAKDQAAKEAEEGRQTLAKLWALFKEHKAKNKSLRDDRYRWEGYLEKPFAHKEVHEILTLDIARLRMRLEKKGLAAATVKQVLVLLKRIINHAVKNGVIPDYDKSRLRFELPKLNNETTEDLNPDELSRLLAAIEEDTHPHAGRLMKLALFTGMRRGELFKLSWADVDFDRGFILLRGPKGGKDSKIPMNATARQLLQELEAEKTDELVVPGRKGVRVDIGQQVRRIRDRAGLPKDFRPLHGLRHVYASMLASSGQVDMYTLQKLLTHKSPQMTARYAHLRDESLAKAGQVVDDIFTQLEAGETKPTDKAASA